MLGLDRRHSSAASTLQGSQSADGASRQPDSSLQPAEHVAASLQQTPGAELAASAHEPSPEDGASDADSDYTEDIPEEIEEVNTVFSQHIRYFHSRNQM